MKQLSSFVYDSSAGPGYLTNPRPLSMTYWNVMPPALGPFYHLHHATIRDVDAVVVIVRRCGKPSFAHRAPRLVPISRRATAGR